MQGAAYKCDRVKLPSGPAARHPPRAVQPTGMAALPGGVWQPAEEAAAAQGGEKPAGSAALPWGERQPAELPRVDPECTQGGGHWGDITGSSSEHHGPALGARGDDGGGGAALASRGEGHDQGVQMRRRCGGAQNEGEGGGDSAAAALMGSAPGQVNKRPRTGDDDGNGGNCGEETNVEAEVDESARPRSHAGGGRWRCAAASGAHMNCHNQKDSVIRLECNMKCKKEIILYSGNCRKNQIGYWYKS